MAQIPNSWTETYGDLLKEAKRLALQGSGVDRG